MSEPKQKQEIAAGNGLLADTFRANRVDKDCFLYAFESPYMLDIQIVDAEKGFGVLSPTLQGSTHRADVCIQIVDREAL